MHSTPSTPGPDSAAPTETDSDSVVITHARVIDGTGAPAYLADVVIDRGRITSIVAPGSATAPHSETALPQNHRLIHAAGAVVCPGFIDVHSHADNAAILDEDDLTKISQGITTEVTGNCGYSLAPVAHGAEAEFLADSRKLFQFEYSGWHGVSEWFTLLDRRASVVNACPLIGHGTLRLATIGTADIPATQEDVAAMGRLLTDAVNAGAFGLSTGLIYPPGFYSSTEELALLAAHLPADRVYATHMRDESSRLLESIDEALTIGRTAGCRVQISHLKAAGKQNWGGVTRALEALDAARAEGLRVTQDVYPYSAAATSLSACLPPWAHDGGAEATMSHLSDPESLRAIKQQIDGGDDGTWENIIFGAGYEGILVADTRSGQHDGKTLTEIAHALAIDPVDALLRVLHDEQLDARMIVFDMDENDLEAALRSRYTSIGSDGLPPGREGRQHPRLYGTFPRVLGRYVRERRVLDLPEAIRRMTSLPAETFGVPERGTLQVGMVADLVCFDPKTIDHPGTYVEPELPPTGIHWVMQTGHVVMRAGEWAGTRRGSRLRPSDSPR